jgi:cytosine/adenosine deaminase-related metal-dependent hydrolase
VLTDPDTVSLELRRYRSAQAGALALVGATLIDCTGSPARPDCTVYVDGGRIEFAGPSPGFAVPAEATAVDCSGKFVIPGLWDMHVNWYDQETLGLFLANGVLGARQFWGTPEYHDWNRDARTGRHLSPRWVVGSTPLDGPEPLFIG